MRSRSSGVHSSDPAPAEFDSASAQFDPNTFLAVHVQNPSTRTLVAGTRRNPSTCRASGGRRPYAKVANNALVARDRTRETSDPMDLIVTPTAEHLDLDAVRFDPHPRNDERDFPDGEVYVQLETVDAIDEAFVVHAGQPRPNEGLAYLYGVLSLLSDHDVPVTLCFTYTPYSMQDRSFYPGTLNYARTLLETVTECFGVQHVYAVDPHFGHRDWVGTLPLTPVHSFPAIQERVKADVDDFVVVGPDLGAVERFGIPSFEKTRTSAYDVALAGELDVAGSNVLVFDDLIETGGTMVAAYARLMNQGADRVVAAAVHAVLGDGIRRVRDTYDALYLTNSIANDAATVPVEPLVLDAFEDAARRVADESGDRQP